MVTVTIDGKEKQYPQGTTYEVIANEYQEQYGGKDRQHQLKTFHGRTTFRGISRSM